MAINQLFSETFTNLGAVTTLYGRAIGAATSVPTGQKGPWVITRTGVGLLTITLNRKFAGLLSAKFTVIDTGTIDDWAVTVDTDLTTGNTIPVAIWKSSTAPDLPTTATLLIEITLQDTAAKPAGY